MLTNWIITWKIPIVLSKNKRRYNIIPQNGLNYVKNKYIKIKIPVFQSADTALCLDETPHIWGLLNCELITTQAWQR